MATCSVERSDVLVEEGAVCFVKGTMFAFAEDRHLENGRHAYTDIQL
jgi:hypothetical protein